jgi:hypothetical protein
MKTASTIKGKSEQMFETRDNSACIDQASAGPTTITDAGASIESLLRDIAFGGKVAPAIALSSSY